MLNLKSKVAQVKKVQRRHQILDAKERRQYKYHDQHLEKGARGGNKKHLLFIMTAWRPAKRLCFPTRGGIWKERIRADGTSCIRR